MIYKVKASHDGLACKFHIVLRDGYKYERQRSLLPQEYMHLFEKQAVYPDLNELTIYKVPLIPDWKMKVDIEVDSEIEIPHFLFFGAVFVSEKMKGIIENLDDCHQFTPISIKGPNGMITSYYQMDVRRIFEYRNIEDAKSFCALSAEPLIWTSISSRRIDERTHRLVDTTTCYVDSRFFEGLSDSDLSHITKCAELKVI